MKRYEDLQGGEGFAEWQIFDAIVDAQMASVAPDLLRIKEQVYGVGAGTEEPYTSIGTSPDRMRFDLEVWWPRLDELRQQGVLLSVEDTTAYAQRLVEMAPAELFGELAQVSAEAQSRVAQQ